LPVTATTDAKYHRRRSATAYRPSTWFPTDQRFA
jgi:hypothetical protein